MEQDLPPFMDPDIDYVGVAKLRHRMTARDLKDLRRPLAVMAPGNDKPVAVVITWKQYLAVLANFIYNRVQHREDPPIYPPSA